LNKLRGSFIRKAIKIIVARIVWIGNRSASMPILEYVYRIRILKRNISLFVKIKSNKYCLCNIAAPDYDQINRSIYPNDIINAAKEIIPEKYIDQCIKEADDICNNVFSIFDLKRVYIGDKIDWHLDYKNFITFPMKFSGFIKFIKFASIGDVKYVFEINKHQEFVRLCQAFLFTNKSRYISKLVENLYSWIENNPVLFGMNWSSPTVAAYRLISWTLSFELVRKENIISYETYSKWGQIVFEHIKMISNNYSLYSSAGNHLISEATAVFIGCLRWKIFFDANDRNYLEYMQRKAFNILINEIDKQIYNDGVNHEQAISYQIFSANQFFIALYFGEKCGMKFPEIFYEKLYKSGKFLRLITNRSGTAPQIGDEDNAWPYRLCGQDANRVSEQLGVFGIFFGDSSLHISNRLPESAFWLFGSKEMEKGRKNDVCNDLNLKPVLNYQKYCQNGGYYISKIRQKEHDESLVILDCGPVGTQMTGAHGHSDALSLYLSLGGTWFLVDSGTYHYHNTKIRKFMRLSSAHNTLCFGEGTSQDKYLGPFLWGKRHSARGQMSNDRGRFIGCVKWWSGEVHYRELVISENSLLIIDTWKGKRKPFIFYYINPLLAESIQIKDDYCINMSEGRTKCWIKSEDNKLVLENAMVSPSFYKFANTKRVVIRPQSACGMQKSRIYWENY